MIHNRAHYVLFALAIATVVACLAIVKNQQEPKPITLTVPFGNATVCPTGETATINSDTIFCCKDNTQCHEP